jgi:hypothetical protein
MKPSNSGEGKEPVQRNETQEATKDRGIGDEPNNSTKCPEVADGVARQSEGIAQLSLLCSVRQGVPGRPMNVAEQIAEQQA